MRFQPSAEWYFILIIVFVFALCERKNKNRKLGSIMLLQAESHVEMATA
jgi:hypothetical protein